MDKNRLLIIIVLLLAISVIFLIIDNKHILNNHIITNNKDSINEIILSKFKEGIRLNELKKDSIISNINSNLISNKQTPYKTNISGYNIPDKHFPNLYLDNLQLYGAANFNNDTTVGNGFLFSLYKPNDLIYISICKSVLGHYNAYGNFMEFQINIINN